ncbi:WSC-domain-containing protein [Stipitochalara longipes BDJ]|nr:WSC-domain-containing protein [Stipitochalara longipes BDJ]
MSPGLTSSTVSSTSSSTTPSGTPYHPLGCYTDHHAARTLHSASTNSDSMTVEFCANFCWRYLYFGVEYKTQCYCGDSIASTGVLALASTCNTPCQGESSETCGGSWRLNMYEFGASAASSTIFSSSQLSSSPIASRGSNFLSSSLSSSQVASSSVPGSSSLGSTGIANSQTGNALPKMGTSSTSSSHTSGNTVPASTASSQQSQSSAPIILPEWPNVSTLVPQQLMGPMPMRVWKIQHATARIISTQMQKATLLPVLNLVLVIQLISAPVRRAIQGGEAGMVL